MAISRLFEQTFDSVLMLTWSDWKTEPRSNRYHYASRFAKHVPVFFVQPDLKGAGNAAKRIAEPTELANVVLWHTGVKFPELGALEQKKIVLQGLAQAGVRRPLVWIYNSKFESLIATLHGTFRVYHATEDYFSTDHFKHPPAFREQLQRVLSQVDLLVSVSPGVEESYRTRGGYTRESVILPNGCDAAFFSQGAANPVPAGKNIAFYQGGINNRVDFELLSDVVERLPDWEFRIGGKEEPGLSGWTKLKANPRVKYLGFLTPEQIRSECAQARVGLIPYVQTPNIIERALPIKSFEYVACGLPVVSVPIQALQEYPVFTFARNGAEFAEQIARVAGTRSDPAAIEQRLGMAAKMDYNANIEKLAGKITGMQAERKGQKKNVLVLYDDHSTHVSAIREHLESFGKWSRHNVFYAVATRRAPCPYDMDLFDVIVIHYSVRLSLADHLSPQVAERIARCPRLKVLFIQDEYDTTEIAREWIRRLGMDVVFTCVPPPEIEKIYPPKEFPGVRFVHNLTGYVPESFAAERGRRPLQERSFLIGYRGRALPYWYGDLGQEKQEIGVRVRAYCEERGLPVNIEWEDKFRIYGPAWYEFIENCRAVLGTESGSNIFDDDGQIRAQIERALAENPALTYTEARGKFLAQHEGRVRMNQISPKVFEAISCRTALILFEGDYSGVLVPDVHFWALKKDYGNLASILELLKDDAAVTAMTTRAFDDVIASNRYSFSSFLRQVDAVFESKVDIARPSELMTAVVGFADDHAYRSLKFYSPARFLPMTNVFGGRRLDLPMEVEAFTLSENDLSRVVKRLNPRLLLKFVLRTIWRSLPPSVRSAIEPIKRLRREKKRP